MRLLHTSDWHLGRTLYGRKRDDEFERFLQWMVQQVSARQAEVLVIAGDVFDTTTPSNRAQALYYQFLHQLVASSCQHVVIVAGNHDSPTFLNAPAALLKTLGVHVIGHAMDDVSSQVIVLRDAQQQAQMIVCAVPYLRDRDVRTVTVGETPEDKERNLVQGIQTHYARIAEHARTVQASLPIPVPVVATGHLFAAGGQVIEGDGVRDLYIGSLGQVGVSVFGASFDYVALGHLHVPQVVASQTHIRYSGSPLAMGFGEAGQRKVIVEVDFTERLLSGGRFDADITLIEVPVFQPMMQLRGDLPTLTAQIETLQSSGQTWWVEVLYESDVLQVDLRQRIEQLTATGNVDVLRIKVSRRDPVFRIEPDSEQTLEDLSPEEVFERCLQASQVSETQRDALMATYRQVLAMHAQGADDTMTSGESS